ncbi:MAG: AtpZ/AtpI family protein [Alphaproteobacteria bacterium]|nr:AtpZ/AtpI family protein [Alphaproteobacteria bacterium]
MTQETEQLDSEIQSLKKKTKRPISIGSGISGYNIAITILTDLLGCIFIGCAIGFFLQKVFHTSALLTAGLTLLGGIAGLYSTARYAIRQERKSK